MNNTIYEFEAEIKKVPDIDGAYIEFPYDLKKNWGKDGLNFFVKRTWLNKFFVVNRISYIRGLSWT